MASGERTPLRSVVQFRLLGVVEAEVHGTSARLGDVLQRRLLTALLAAMGQSVCVAELIDWIWDIAPRDPESAVRLVADSLRRDHLRPIGLGGALIDGDGTYRLEVPPEWVDLHQFRTLAERAAQLGDPEAREFLAAALQSVRGVPLADLDGRRIDRYRRELAGELRAVEIRFARIEVDRGRSQELLPRLERLFREFPGDMSIAEVYLAALHGADLAPATLAARTRSARRARENWADGLGAAL
ncbi:AfsR/SARP family transcriptional regulator [Nocardia arizonensis]|nr:BTAD domain-containing putative transcriptional regulator [Nocardia arizonensis]